MLEVAQRENPRAQLSEPASLGEPPAADLLRGLLLAAGTGKILSGMLYEVGALDPVAFTIAPLILAAAALFATWLPARRATRISPMAALRTE